MEDVEEERAVAGKIMAQDALDAMQVGGHEAPKSPSCSPGTDNVDRHRPLKLQTLELKHTSRLLNPASQVTVGQANVGTFREQPAPSSPTYDGR